MEHLKLFCIPFAGGSSLSFANWKFKINNLIDLIPIDLSGKGKRIGEKENSNFDEAVEDIYCTIMKNIKEGENYAVFGHSMGGLLAYETYFLLLKNQCHLPCFMILSGVSLPYKFSIASVPLQSKEEFERYIIDLGGISKDIISMKNLFDEIVFMIKKDYEILTSYSPMKHGRMVQCPGFIFNGKNDKLTKNDCLTEWKQVFEYDVKMFKFDGGHFFINSQMEKVLSLINEIAYTYIEKG